jgi:CubicO group peptidase (beta-lactamase class C family)
MLASKAPAVVSILVLVAAPFAGAPGAEPPAAPKEVLAGSLRPFCEGGALAGAVVLAASREKTLASEAVGSADIAAKKPMATDSLFWIASMSKPITATLVLMLVDEGKVALDDPVEKYLPEFRGQMVATEEGPDRIVLRKPARPITVRPPLTSSSSSRTMSSSTWTGWTSGSSRAGTTRSRFTSRSARTASPGST